MPLSKKEINEALSKGLNYFEWIDLYEKHFGKKMPKTFQHSWGPQPIDLVVDAIVENKEIKRVVVKGEL